jgi:hypothetical protein
VVLDEHGAGGVEHLDDAVGRDLEGLVVAAVLLGRLRHEADVRHRADRRRVERTVRDDVVDHGLVDAGVRRVGDDRDGVVLGAVLAPELAAVAHERGHRGIDDDVGGHVQVRDALVAVDVAEAGPVSRSCAMRAEIASPSASSPRPARIEPSPLLPLRPAAASCSPYASKTSAKNARTTWPKMIGSLTFIIVALRCTE